MAPTLNGSRAERGPRVELHLHRLRAEREQAGLTQQDLAVRCHLTVSTVNRLENGHQSPTLATALMLAQQLGVRVEQLIDLDHEQVQALRLSDTYASNAPAKNDPAFLAMLGVATW